jgi:eukaryotic-like serine/threonine-protein kinase
MSTLLGTTLSGRYRLERRIGSGGMSTVYLATDEKLERSVAVKVMNQEVATDSEQLERFRREARAVAQLNHVNVVGVIDAGEDAGHPYIVFEYVEGETLKDRIRREGPLPIPEAVAYAIEIARALDAAHSHHIVHRDVKPQNVLIDAESGAAKVTDFGIARTLEEEGLTSDGRVIGTTDYVAPEQAMGRPVTGQSDLYSLGIVLYEMLTGELPFKAEGQVAVAMKHVRERMPDVRAARPEVSATLATILDQTTAKDTGRRYSTDQQLIADLEQVLALEAGRAGEVSEPVTSVFESLPADTQSRVPLAVRKRSFSVAFLGLIALLVVAAVAFVVFHAEKGPAPNHVQHKLKPNTPIALVKADAYNPYGFQGDTAQNNGEAPLAIDSSGTTAWRTQTYAGGVMTGKPGVGLYVTTAKAIRAAKLNLTLTTSTPGFDVTIYGIDKAPSNAAATATTTSTPSDLGWQYLGEQNSIPSVAHFSLLTGLKPYKYFLIWITSLPSQAYAAIDSVQLRTT